MTANESFEGLTRFCESGIIDPAVAVYGPALHACKREWQEADEDGRESAIEFWAFILRQWDGCQSDTRQVRILTDAFGNAGPDICDSLPYLYRLVCQLAADNGGRWFEDDGLREGRDYEFVGAEDEDLVAYTRIPAFYMFPETGSVDTEDGWKEDCASGGGEFEPADFGEVCSMNPPALLGKHLSDCDPDGWMEISRISDQMDAEIRERVHDESHWLHAEGYGYMSDQAFLIRYSHLHAEKFGSDFNPEED